MLKDLDKIVKQFDNDDWKYVNDAWANQFFTHDNYVKSVHNAEMDNLRAEKDEVIQETAKLLYKQNTSIEEIAKVTKLSVQTIENIINDN